MHYDYKEIISILDSIRVDKYNIYFYFKGKNSSKIISTLPFEPYEGKIIITWKDILFHPIKSYNKYYHTPIFIYSNEVQNNLLLKAFKNISKNFKWDYVSNKYICIK